MAFSTTQQAINLIRPIGRLNTLILPHVIYSIGVWMHCNCRVPIRSQIIYCLFIIRFYYPWVLWYFHCTTAKCHRMHCNHRPYLYYIIKNIPNPQLNFRCSTWRVWYFALACDSPCKMYISIYHLQYRLTVAKAKPLFIYHAYICCMYAMCVLFLYKYVSNNIEYEI